MAGALCLLLLYCSCGREKYGIRIARNNNDETKYNYHIQTQSNNVPFNLNHHIFINSFMHCLYGHVDVPSFLASTVSLKIRFFVTLPTSLSHTVSLSFPRSLCLFCLFENSLFLSFHFNGSSIQIVCIPNCDYTNKYFSIYISLTTIFIYSFESLF